MDAGQRRLRLLAALCGIAGAVSLGGAFAFVGFAGLFNPVAASAITVLLVGEELRLAAASIVLVARTPRAAGPGLPARRRPGPMMATVGQHR